MSTNYDPFESLINVAPKDLSSMPQVQVHKPVYAESSTGVNILNAKFNAEFYSGSPTATVRKSKITLAEKIALWRNRPKLFFEEVLGMKLDAWQEDFVKSFLNNERTVAVASKGVGKTKLLGGCAIYMLVLYYEPKIAVMSVTKDHLKDNLWAEMIKFIEQSPFLKSILKYSATRITFKDSETAFISARSIPKGAGEEEMKSALAGLHANHVSFMVDEAGSLPDSLWDTADAILANENLHPTIPKFARILACANAEMPRGLFYRVYTSNQSGNKSVEAKQWSMINISSDPLDPKRSTRVSKEWAQGVIDKYGGRDHPVVKINVLGIYPDTSQELFLSEWEIDEAMRRSYEEHLVAHHEPSIGVDVSRGGDDTIIATRRGLTAYPFVRVDPKSDGHEVGRAVLREAYVRKTTRVKVDGTGGYGLSVIDYLKAEGSLDVVSVVYNRAATKPESYNNIRTEMYCKMRDWIRAGGALPPDPMLKEDLLAPKINIRGSRFELEPKEEIRKRLGRSPDRADALAQTFVDIDTLLESAIGANQDPDIFDENGNRRSTDEILLLKTLRMRQSQGHQGNHRSEDQGMDTERGYNVNLKHLS